MFDGELSAEARAICQNAWRFIEAQCQASVAQLSDLHGIQTVHNRQANYPTGPLELHFPWAVFDEKQADRLTLASELPRQLQPLLTYGLIVQAVGDQPALAGQLRAARQAWLR